MNHQDSFGSTPLMIAGGNNDYEMVLLLLDLGADPLIKDSSGYDFVKFLDKFGGRAMDKKSSQYEAYLKVAEKIQGRRP